MWLSLSSSKALQMAFQQSDEDLQALKLIKRSLIQKRDMICHLQQELETWKGKYLSKEKEVQFLKTQLNKQQNCSNTNDEKDLETFCPENSISYGVEVKEEVFDEDNWLENDANTNLGRLGNKRSISESNESEENLKRSRLRQAVQAHEVTTELIPSLCSDGLPATPGSSRNVSLMGSSTGQHTVQVADQTFLGRSSTEMDENVEHLESREYPPARGEERESLEGSPTGEKPFACTLEGCAYRCARSFDLKIHARIHTGEKPFACTVEDCAFRCISSSHLKKHVRTHTGEKPFACTVEGCAYRCAGSYDLKIHARTHTGEKPFACTVEGCAYRCALSSNLKKHVRKHTGEKPFASTVEGCAYRTDDTFHMTKHA